MYVLATVLFAAWFTLFLPFIAVFIISVVNFYVFDYNKI